MLGHRLAGSILKSKLSGTGAVNPSTDNFLSLIADRGLWHLSQITLELQLLNRTYSTFREPKTKEWPWAAFGHA